MPSADVEYPEMSTEEKEIYGLLAEDIKQGRFESQQLLPYILEEYGLQISPLSVEQQDIKQAQWDAEIAKLEGERHLAQERLLDETFGRNGVQRKYRLDSLKVNSEKIDNEYNNKILMIQNQKNELKSGIRNYTFTRMSDEEMFSRMSPEEQKRATLNRAQLDQELIQSGFNPETLSKFTSETERQSFLTPEQRQFEELQSAVTEREIAAIKGELPISAALERELAQFEQTTTEEVRRRGGTFGDLPGVTTAEALNRAKETSIIAKEAARFGQAGALESIRSSISQTGLQTGFGELSELGAISDIISGTKAGKINTFAGIPSGTGSAGGIISGFANQRAGIFGAESQTAAGNRQDIYSIASIIGLLAGGA